MNNINLDFSPDVEVFDANISIGRRHNRRMPVDTTTQAIECLKQAGVSKALTFSTHSLYVDAQSGNNNLKTQLTNPLHNPLNAPSKNNLKTNEIVGMKYNLLSKVWKLSNDTSVNYIGTFIKN